MTEGEREMLVDSRKQRMYTIFMTLSRVGYERDLPLEIQCYIQIHCFVAGYEYYTHCLLSDVRKGDCPGYRPCTVRELEMDFHSGLLPRHIPTDDTTFSCLRACKIYVYERADDESNFYKPFGENNYIARPHEVVVKYGNGTWNMILDSDSCIYFENHKNPVYHRSYDTLNKKARFSKKLVYYDTIMSVLVKRDDDMCAKLCARFCNSPK
jgi:hypothetical protein